MDSSAHVVLHNHVAIRTIVLSRTICWMDHRAVACAHHVPVFLTFRWYLQRKGRLPRWVVSR
eukprot:626909-Pyramimonas_sp.AAC.1